MKIIARGVGRRKEAVAQVLLVKREKDTPGGLFIINNRPADHYIQNNFCSLLTVKAPLSLLGIGNTSPLSSSSSREDIQNNLNAKKTKSVTEEDANIPQKELFGKKDNGNGSFLEPSFSDLERLTPSDPDYTLSPLFEKGENINTIVKVKGGGLIGQAEAIKLGLARALCQLFRQTDSTSAAAASGRDYLFLSHADENKRNPISTDGLEKEVLLENPDSRSSLGRAEKVRKELKDKGYLTQDSRIKERRKYGLKKARKASQYHKR
jgi:ribosomal protein S9